MITRVQKWGNSLGVRIPRAYADEIRIESGSSVKVAVRGDALVVTPVRRSAYRLSELLRQVKRSNLHGEVTTGRAVGRESW